MQRAFEFASEMRVDNNSRRRRRFTAEMATAETEFC